jgi:hypothetical protein
MTERILGEAGTKRRRRFVLLPILMVACTALFFVAGAQAVHDIGVFELEGNATTDHATSGLPDDWDRVCHQVLGTDCSTTFNTSGATGVSFKSEPDRAASIFTGGGSKDDLNIRGGPGTGWQWKNQGGLPDKDNLRDGFAARYTCVTASGCTGTAGDSLLYFGADRFDNSGDAQIGFWFLQGDVSNLSGGTFGPDSHTDGDVLILSDFTGGGGTPTIRIFAWDPDCSSGCNPATDLVNDTLLPLGGGTATPADCPSVGPGDGFCAVVNSDPTPGTNPADDNTTSPWTFTDKSKNTAFAPGEFYEGGLNLTALALKFPGLAGECFASFSAETRSSQSPDATLKDFIIGSFQPCQSGIVTTPANATITKGQSINDSAVVTGTGAGTPTGKVKFFICSPTQLDTNGECTGVAPTGSTQVIKTGSDATGEPLVPDANDATKANATSGSFTPTSVGTWCFRGEYVPAAGSPYDPSTDHATTECFTVTNITISTAQTYTVKDSATITPQGPGASLGGTGSTVRFRLYANADCSGTTTLVDESKTVSSSTSAVTVETTPVTITAHPTLSWLVQYTHGTGSTPQDVTSTCGTENASLAISNG